MSMIDDISGIIRERQAELPQVATIQGQQVPCSVSIIDQGRDVITGGKWIVYRGTLTYLIADLETLPLAGQQIIFNNQTLYIEMVHANPNFPHVKLEISNTPPPR